MVNTVYFGKLDTVFLPMTGSYNLTISIPREVRTRTVPSPFASFVRLGTQFDTYTNQISLRAVTSDLNYSLVYAIQFGFSV